MRLTATSSFVTYRIVQPCEVPRAGDGEAGMAPFAHALRLIPARSSGAVTSNEAATSCRLTAWLTKVLMLAEIAFRSAADRWRPLAPAWAASVSASEVSARKARRPFTLRE